MRNATYISAGNDGSAFAMSGNQINVNAALDYGTKNSYTLTVRATDGASNTGDVDATVTISLNTSKNRNIVSFKAAQNWQSFWHNSNIYRPKVISNKHSELAIGEVNCKYLPYLYAI